jgi:hypothetical protein
MSDKQSLLQVVGALPDAASWTEITDALLRLVAARGSATDFTRLYRENLKAEQLAEYLNPSLDYRLEDVIAELESQPPARDPA